VGISSASGSKIICELTCDCSGAICKHRKGQELHPGHFKAGYRVVFSLAASQSLLALHKVDQLLEIKKPRVNVRGPAKRLFCDPRGVGPIRSDFFRGSALCLVFVQSSPQRDGIFFPGCSAENQKKGGPRQQGVVQPSKLEVESRE